MLFSAVKKGLFMDIKGLGVIVLLPVMAGCSMTKIKQASPEEINFKKYAYAICIGSAFEADEVKSDASRSANGYMEYGNISLDAYQELRERVDYWLDKPYLSKSGGSLQIMKCNDFYHSDEISNIYMKHDPCRSSDGWLDLDEYKTQCGI